MARGPIAVRFDADPGTAVAAELTSLLTFVSTADSTQPDCVRVTAVVPSPPPPPA